jgi:branched-subunit amino acid transport protein
MRELVVLAAIGLGTYAFRVAFLVSSDARQSAALTRMLPYVGPAVLAAITVPMLLAPQGGISAAASLPALAASAVSWLLWRRTGGLLVPLVGGLALWWLLTALLPG